MISQTTIDGLESVARRMCARVLTQICRDVSSPAYGCCDRNWWHYKIRDFPSIILQQGGYALFEARDMTANAWSPSDRDAITALAAGSARFWNRRATRRGAFEEYYPWERGYPPLAFSTLAVTKLADQIAGLREDVEPGIRVAAKQLRDRFEAKAANQQVAGLAALAWIQKLWPELAPGNVVDSMAERTLALQNEEGWFEEYGGPDLGYLAVTIDCLWDLYDATGDAGFRESIGRAFGFLRDCVDAHGGSVGMHNARNTDYIVPYGIARLAAGGGESGRQAAHVLDTLFHDADDPGHFLGATDDRYLSHYIGHSLARAVRVVRGRGEEGGAPEARRGIPPDRAFPNCGYVIRRPSGAPYHYHISLKKGGVFTLFGAERGAVCSDFGWIVPDGKRQWINHWWSGLWKAEEAGQDHFVVSGELFSHQEAASSPPKHFVLRVLSLVFGDRLIALLKNRLIFKTGAGGNRFRREVVFGESEVAVTDEIFELRRDVEPVRAGRSSKRHVASADSFHPDDLSLLRGWQRSVVCERLPDRWRATTAYRVAAGPLP